MNVPCARCGRPHNPTRARACDACYREGRALAIEEAVTEAVERERERLAGAKAGEAFWVHVSAGDDGRVTLARTAVFEGEDIVLERHSMSAEQAAQLAGDIARAAGVRVPADPPPDMRAEREKLLLRAVARWARWYFEPRFFDRRQESEAELRAAVADLAQFYEELEAERERTRPGPLVDAVGATVTLPTQPGMEDAAVRACTTPRKDPQR